MNSRTSASSEAAENGSSEDRLTISRQRSGGRCLGFLDRGLLEAAGLVEAFLHEGDLGVELLVAAGKGAGKLEGFDRSKPVLVLDGGLAEQACRDRVFTINLEGFFERFLRF